MDTIALSALQAAGASLQATPTAGLGAAPAATQSQQAAAQEFHSHMIGTANGPIQSSPTVNGTTHTTSAQRPAWVEDLFRQGKSVSSRFENLNKTIARANETMAQSDDLREIYAASNSASYAIAMALSEEQMNIGLATGATNTLKSMLHNSDQ
ncbi:hypothetical protein R20233_00153 [Ralstonia sp. LMG 32965]|uniref:hypothetical protein n=1 Tax=Ralstonia flatus TaxID=3058601 RepID=UPI0028F52D86|nr:hypothetical protein [Ralstonia sp. LMG 32965]CAJ0853655.1 hypothetical protein R20233_00153 [Ralstonia sp. LMG 32965]